MDSERIGLIALSFDDPIFLGNLADSLQEVLQANIPAYSRVEIEVGDPMQLPEEAYDRKREQYIASALLEPLERNRGEYEKVLGITNADLFEPSMNFVFGVANIGQHAAVISLKRLHPSFYGEPEHYGRFFERSLKEAVHEIGHLYWLPHCPDPRCVMHYSNALPDTDRKSVMFCPATRSELERRFR